MLRPAQNILVTARRRGSPELPGRKAQLRVAAQDVHNAQHGADALRQHRGNGRAAHAQPQRPHERGVQPDVQHAAEQQEQQRRHAVADGAQQCSLHIIKHRQRDAQQNDGQVGGRAAPCLCRDLQNGQQRVAAQQGAPRQHQRHHRRQRDHPAHGAAYPAFIARAKIAADRQRQAVVHAEGKVHDKPVQRRRRADLRQRGGAQQVPCQRSVGQVVQLLQKVGAEQRHRKLQHQAERVALGHIQHTAFVRGGHNVTSPLLVAGSIIRDGTGRVNRIIPARDPDKTAGNAERNVWNFPKQSNSFADGKPGPGVV